MQRPPLLGGRFLRSQWPNMISKYFASMLLAPTRTSTISRGSSSSSSVLCSGSSSSSSSSSS
eukprot:4268263-Prorocentrum_lima.AAC.1